MFWFSQAFLPCTYAWHTSKKTQYGDLRERSRRFIFILLPRVLTALVQIQKRLRFCPLGSLRAWLPLCSFQANHLSAALQVWWFYFQTSLELPQINMVVNFLRLVFTNDRVGIRSKNLVKTVFWLRLRLRHLRSSENKTHYGSWWKLSCRSETSAEVEELNQSKSVWTCIAIGLSFPFCFWLRQSGLNQPPSQVLSRSVGQGRRGPWERGWVSTGWWLWR